MAAIHHDHTVYRGREKADETHDCHTEGEYGPKGSAVAARLTAAGAFTWQTLLEREKGGEGRERRKEGNNMEG